MLGAKGILEILKTNITPIEHSEAKNKTKGTVYKGMINEITVKSLISPKPKVSF
jgi:hypothetical protein